MSRRLRLLVASAAGVALAAGIVVLLTSSSPATAVSRPKPALVVNTDASPVPVTVVNDGARTHLGVPIEDHVMLVIGDSAQTPCSENGDGPGRDFHRIHPDGAIDAGPFIVPSGRHLVVTDADAVMVAGSGQTFDLGRVVDVTITTPANFGGVTGPLRTSGVTIANTTTESVAVGVNVAAGVVFGPGEQVCMRADQRSADGGFFDLPIQSATVFGYLL